MRLMLGAILLLSAGVLLHYEIEPVPTWFYVFAWYPTLVLLDEIGSKLDGRPSALWRTPAIHLFLWSPAVWFVFELANFRLDNWYYISLPHEIWARWLGIVLSFATVVPAVLLAERALDAAGLFRVGKGPSISIRPWEINAAVTLGLGMGTLSVVYPTLFFPLIWGAVFLIVDPFVYKRKPSLSLLGDLERGRWGRIGRLMVGGLGIGLLWEFFNYWARGKWVYTVPWLEEIKLFEMPPFGFVGFPVFTLEAWSMYAALCVFGVAVPLGKTGPFDRKRVGGALAITAAFSVTVLLGMERLTISSTTPQLANLPGLTSSDVETLRSLDMNTPYDIVESEPTELATMPNLNVQTANTARNAALLSTLRGIGTAHAQTLLSLGITTVCELSDSDPEALWETVRRETDRSRPSPAEVRVWVRAAGRACESIRE